VAGTKDGTAVSWRGMSSAVALLTARRAGSGDRQADILGDQSLSEVIAALEIVAVALLGASSPDKGASLLEALGLLALTKDAERAGGSE
jgi:hypothetical protein